MSFFHFGVELQGWSARRVVCTVQKKDVRGKSMSANGDFTSVNYVRLEASD